MQNQKKLEINPPWIEYPDYPPYDTFWRQSGECWLIYVWQPYWHGLSQQEKEEYLKKWHVPKVWHDFYFDEQWRHMLESIDSEIE